MFGVAFSLKVIGMTVLICAIRTTNGIPSKHRTSSHWRNASNFSSSLSGELFQTSVRFSVIEKSLSAEFRADFPNYSEGLVRGDPGRFVLTPKYADSVNDFLNVPLRADDVWVVTFPKSGTTWTQEMVWLIAHDFDTVAGKQPLTQRSPFLESSSLMQGDSDDEDGGFLESKLGALKHLAAMTSPRVIKSHLPLYLLPPSLVDTCKVVYVARNPKDVIVSFFHHHRLFYLHEYTGDIDKFAEYFMNDEGNCMHPELTVSSEANFLFSVYYSPFFAHVLEGWARRDHPNFLFIFYEDMKSNLRREIERVCQFLGKTPTEKQVELLVKHLRFDSFSKNKLVNYESLREAGAIKPGGKFTRKGISSVTLILVRVNIDLDELLGRQNWRLEESFQSRIESFGRQLDRKSFERKRFEIYN